MSGAWCFWANPSTGYEELIRHDTGGTNCRPVLVIDPEDREQVERLAAGYERDDQPGERAVDDMQAALRSLLVTKPEEPQGLGAVVRDDQRVVWVRARDTSHICWRSSGIWREWADLNVSTPDQILSAGWVEDGAL